MTYRTNARPQETPLPFIARMLMKLVRFVFWTSGDISFRELMLPQSDKEKKMLASFEEDDRLSKELAAVRNNKDPLAKCSINGFFYERMIFDLAKDIIRGNGDGKVLLESLGVSGNCSLTQALEYACKFMTFDLRHASRAAKILASSFGVKDIDAYSAGMKRKDLVALIDKASENTT